MGYMNEFPHSRMFDSDLREILEMYNTVKGLPADWDTFKQIMNSDYNTFKEDFIGQQVDEWLDEHPEATTTVQDNSLTKEKFTEKTRLETIKDYITPQMYKTNNNSWSDAIQTAINENSGKIIYFPSGTYEIDKPIILIDDGTRILGENRQTTTIKKITNTPDSYYNINSVIIFDTINHRNSGQGYYINNISVSSNGDSSIIDYGLYFAKPSGYLQLNNVIISNCKLGIFIKGCWVSELKNILIYECNNGIKINDNSTSTNFSDVYVLGSKEIAFDINSLNYSSWNNIACDRAIGYCYKFDYSNITINGLGCESPEATCSISVSNNSNITINNGLIFPSNSNDYVAFHVYDSILTLNGGGFGQAYPTSNGKEISLAIYGNIVFENFKRTTTFSTPNNIEADSGFIKDNSINSTYNNLQRLGKFYNNIIGNIPIQNLIQGDDNWNTLNSGVYFFNTWTGSGGEGVIPTNSTGIMLKFIYDSREFNLAFSDSFIAFRTSLNSVWSDWKILQ